MGNRFKVYEKEIQGVSLIGDGEMADRIRALNWEMTALGPISEWPETLIVAVNMMLSASHPILLLWGPELILLYNDAFRPILTDRHPESLGQRGREFWTDVWPVVGQQLESVLLKAQAVSSQNALVPIMRNGKLEDAYFNYSYSPVFTPRGEVAGVITICQDVTANTLAGVERMGAEKALRSRQEELDRTLRALGAERARLLKIVQQAPAFFVLLEGPTHVITMVNSLYLKLVGDRNLLGKPVAEALPEAVEQGYVAMLDRVLSTGEPVTGQGARFDVSWAEGQAPDEHYLDFTYQPLREEDNSISGIIVLGVDVTENKRQQKALAQNEKLAFVGRLASSIAHEINNPLAAVTNLLYLARSSGSQAQMEEFLDRADDELRRIAVISNQTLSFSKHASDPQTVTSADLIDSAINVYRGRLKSDRLDVEKQIRSCRAISCFEGQIRQVLNNLVGNALDAMQGRRGRLLLRSQDARDWRSGQEGVLITVADTGGGVPAEFRKKIFEPFFTTKGQSGTGLGLSVSQDIVARHKGWLRFRSSQKFDHTGTVFSMFLPTRAIGG